MSKGATTEEDAFALIEDQTAESSNDRPEPVWRVLVVDDDEELHQTTRIALRGTRVLDRKLELVHAYSARECIERIEELRDVAIAMIDVVMETPDAGLRLVERIRARGLMDMRIMLRTGQSGYEPELCDISKYEIEDYRTKAELTQRRLIAVLASSIRAYDQIQQSRHSRVGLGKIVGGSKARLESADLEDFARQVLSEVEGLLYAAPRDAARIESPAGGAEPRDGAAELDPVLNVPNQSGFEAILATTAFGAKRLALVGVDAYPAIVANHGVANARRYLAALCETLTAGRDDVTVARVADDVLALLADRDRLTPNALRSAFDRVYDIDGVVIGASATGAILDLGGGASDSASLMRIARAALQHAQQTARGACIVYDSGADAGGASPPLPETPPETLPESLAQDDDGRSARTGGRLAADGESGRRSGRWRGGAAALAVAHRFDLAGRYRDDHENGAPEPRPADVAARPS